jgi:hypothetical protein
VITETQTATRFVGNLIAGEERAAIRDEAPNTGLQNSLLSEFYFHDGASKPALQSFHSP